MLFVQAPDMRVQQGSSLQALWELGQRKGYSLGKQVLFESCAEPYVNSVHNHFQRDICAKRACTTARDAASRTLPSYAAFRDDDYRLFPGGLKALEWFGFSSLAYVAVRW